MEEKSMPQYLRDKDKIYVNVRTWYSNPAHLNLYEYAATKNLNDRLLVTKDRKIMFRCSYEKMSKM